METPSTAAQPSFRTVTVEGGKVFCKCEDGWSCTITKIDDASEAVDPFYKCGDETSCTCTPGTKEGEQIIQVEGGSKAICNCPEGWKCIVYKTNEAPPAKSFFECGHGCKCEIVSA